MIGKLIPTWCWLAAIGALVVGIGAQQVRVSNAKANTAAAQQDLANDRTRYAQLAQAAEQAARLEENRRADAARKVIDEAQTQTTIARDDAVRALSAAERLRKRTVQLTTAGCRCANPTTAASCKAAGTSLDLLAKLYGESDERSGQLAEYADAARIAGNTCEAAYSSLWK